MPPPPHAAWSLLLLLASQWEWLCSHKAYDWRASTADCVRYKGGTECVAVPAYCVSPVSIAWASPRWLSSLAGYGGPLLTWLPLLYAARPAAVIRPLLGTTLVWYLAFISVVRHTHLLLPSRWDPSGHCFVYGAQLLPLWAISALPELSGGRRRVPRALRLWSGVLVYLSCATAAWFHTASETGAAWLLLLLLYAALSSRLAAMQAAAAACSLEAAADVAQRERRRVGRCALLLALPVWLVGSAAAWEAARRSGAGVGMRSGEAAYDVGLWLLLLLLLLRRGERATGADEPRDSDSEERVLKSSAALSDAGSNCSDLRSREPSPSEPFRD